MKFFGKLFLAVLATFFLHCLMYEMPTTAITAVIKYYVRAVPMPTMVLILWGVFTFPKAVGQVLQLIANTLLQTLKFTTNAAGQTLEHLWKYRAGQIFIGGAVSYLLYIFIF